MINAYQQDVAYRRYYSSYDKWGEPVGSINEDAYECRWIFKTQWITIKGGEMVKSNAFILLDSGTPVDHKDRWMYQSMEYITLDIQKPKAFNAINFVKVYVQ